MYTQISCFFINQELDKSDETFINNSNEDYRRYAYLLSEYWIFELIPDKRGVSVNHILDLKLIQIICKYLVYSVLV
jgi:hypothetical protein